MGWFLCLSCGGVNSNPFDREYDNQLRALCQRLVECSQEGFGSVDDCVKFLGGLVFRKGCVEASVKAPCEDHAISDSDYAAICWDKCSGETQYCRSDQLHSCTNGNLWVFDCKLHCQYRLTSPYTGVCGKLSPDGSFFSEKEICWCE